LAEHERVEALEPEQAALVVLLRAALQRQRRIKRAFRNLHRLQGDVDIILRRRDLWMRRRAEADRTVKVLGEKAIDRRARRELSGSTPIT
jgi:hypothetical protein